LFLLPYQNIINPVKTIPTNAVEKPPIKLIATSLIIFVRFVVFVLRSTFVESNLVRISLNLSASQILRPT
jgi:hypothetical protein